MNKLIIGSRASKLAIAQTNIVKEKLEKLNSGIKIEIKEITTIGDKNLTVSPESLKGAFTKEIEEALLNNEIDIAVHSMKDMATICPSGLIYASVPEREDARDVLISKKNIKFKNLPKNSIIGTTSLRRANYIRLFRYDLIVKPIRGNILTRLKKLENENYDAIIIAAAAIKRLHLENIITEYFSIEDMLPAPGQGALCIECREKDIEIINMLKSIENKEIRELVDIERKFASLLDSGCNAPIGSFTEITEDNIILYGSFFYNGNIYKDKVISKIEDKNNLANRLYDKIKEQINLNN